MIKSIHYVSKCDVMPVRSVLFSIFMVMAAAVSARTILVPAQPVSEFADTEVSTNIVLHASRTDTREFGIHIQLAGTPTNNLSLCFGRDVNTNGVLDVGEIETVYGWRAGRYFVEDVVGWRVYESPVTNAAKAASAEFRVENAADGTPRRFVATCAGASAFPGLPSGQPPDWLFRREWDMMRVVRRGAGAASEWVWCDVGHGYFHVRVR